jgi:hypothetical protein
MPILNPRAPKYIPQPKLVQNYNGFAGGLNLFYTPTEIKKTELVQSDNCMLIGEGVLTSRWGSQVYLSAGSTTIRMLEKYENLNTGANELLYVNDSGYLRKKSGASTTLIGGASFASGAIINSSQIANYQYIVSSSTNLCRYDGTNITIYSGISSPASLVASFVSGATGTATWSYKVSAFSNAGETLPSSSALLTNMSFDRENFTANLTWVMPSTASGLVKGFGIYAGLPGDETLIATVGSTVTSFRDSGIPQSSTFPQTTNTTSGVKAKYITRFDDRLVLAGVENDPTMLMISGKYPYQDRFNWQNGGGYIRIAPDSGDEITGIETIGQSSLGGITTPGILVFMKESVYLVTLSYIEIGNYSVLTPQYQLVAPVGCSSFRSIVNIQNNTFYFGRTGLQTIGAEQAYLNQIRTREVSARIRPYVKGVTDSDLNRVASGYLDYKYLFSFPGTKDTMVYDYERGCFIGPWKTPFGITQWLEYIDDNGKVLYLAGCDDGKIRDFNSIYKSDSGTAIVKIVKTKKDDFNNWSVLKTIEIINTLFRNVSGTVSIQILYEQRDGTTASEALSFELQGSSGGTGWGSDLWGTKNYGTTNLNITASTPEDIIRWTSFYKVGRTIQIEVTQTQTETNFELVDLKIIASLQPEGSISSANRI